MNENESLHGNLHPELHSLLLPFHRLNGHPLRSVWRVYSEGSMDKIVLAFDHEFLVIEADARDDTVNFSVSCDAGAHTNGWTDASSSEPWARFIGEEFGWGWIIINQQDALDGILLSFNGITPQVILNVMASSIKESIISEVES